MHSSPNPPSSPPSPSLPYAGISTLILVYVIIAYIVVDFIDDNEESGSGFVESENVGPLQLSVQDIEAALPWFENEADVNIGCVICLDLLHKGEKCRCLPECRHVFHAECIELWLLKRLSCPICRSPLVVNGLEAV